TSELYDTRGPQLHRDLRLALALSLEQDSEDQLTQPPCAAERHWCRAEVLERIPAQVSRSERAHHPRVAAFPRDQQIGRRFDDEHPIDQRIVIMVEFEDWSGFFDRGERVEVLRVISIEEARSLENDRREELGDDRLVCFPDAGEAQHAGVFGVAQHGVRHLPDRDDSLLPALHNRYGRYR